MTAPVRDRPDACPGALRTHRAADGLLVRLRLPGGRLTAAAARGLADAADRYADGEVHLTSRGNLQLRGVREVDGGAEPALVATVRAAGLLPSASHELVRNVVASPWSGRRGGRVDVGPLVAAVDAALCADAALARLPGRFLVALDDGTGDVAGLDADVTWWAQPDGAGAMLVGGVDTGRRVPVDAAAEAVAGVARAFLRARAEAGEASWHVGELRGGAAAFAVSLRPGGGGARAHPVRPPLPSAGLATLGRVRQDDGRWAVAALVPLGRLSAAGLRLLADGAESGTGTLVVTPWREVVVPDVAPHRLTDVEQQLATAGLVSKAGSGWRMVTACVGRPGCGRALADVRALAGRTVARLEAASDAGQTRVHLAGCERRCGRPASEHVEAVADPTGFSVATVAAAAPSGAERSRRKVGPDATPAATTVALLLSRPAPSEDL